MALVSADPKSELNQFLQKFLKRPVTKTDTEFTTSKYGPYKFQCVLKLACLQGQEYAGEVCADPKAAEKAAAQQALVANADAVTDTMSTPTDKKRKGPPQNMTFEEREAKKAKQLEEGISPDNNPAITPKTQLNSLCMRIAKRYLQKGETVYECHKVGTQYQATLVLACLPDDWAQRSWAGQVCSTKQKAEQSVAEEALKDIQADPELTAEAAKPKGMGKGGGKGGKKGKMMAMMNSMGWGGAWPQMGGKGKGMPGKGGFDQTRERVTEFPVIGTVEEWKGSFGFLQCLLHIEHPSATKRGGKIFFHKKDLSGVDVDSLMVGQTLSFQIYADGSGLGAEEVTSA